MFVYDQSEEIDLGGDIMESGIYRRRPTVTFFILIIKLRSGGKK